MPLRYILGAQKAGSTTLWYTLGACPASSSALAKPLYEKETHFIDMPSCMNATGPAACKLAITRAGYTSMWTPSSCESRCSVEGTPDFLYNPSVAPQLHRLMWQPERPRARFVAILREPISRDVAYFNHRLRIWPRDQVWGLQPSAIKYESYVEQRVREWKRCLDSRNLTDWHAHDHHVRARNASQKHLLMHSAADTYAQCSHKFNSLAIGMYAGQLGVWTRWFPREQFLIGTMDEMLSQPVDFHRRVLEFLRIPPRMNDEFSSWPQLNSVHGFKFEVVNVSCRACALLQTVYAPWNHALFKLEPQLQLFTPARACVRCGG